MKQFDQFKNNEYLPTEEDFLKSVLVTTELPAANAQNLGKTYLLNGVQEGYVKSHFYKCVLQDETYVWSDLNVGKFSVGNCSNIRFRMFDDSSAFRVIIAWNDPDDVIVGTERTAWTKTVLVHQVGHMPINVTDGEIMATSTRRDMYSVFGSLCLNLNVADTSRKHYFKLFPYSDDGAITNDDQNGRVAGYNYVVTSDLVPYTINNNVYEYTKQYYARELNQTTGLYEYTAVYKENTTYFTTFEAPDGSTQYKFKANTVLYEYQNLIMNWPAIRELVQNGEAEQYFKLGSIITLPYHGDFGEMAYEVVDFDNVQPADPNVKHTMTLESKYLYQWWDYYDTGIVFDTNERAGAVSKDTTRDNNKTYFARITEVTSTAATAIAATEGEAAVYVETCFDETRRDYHTGAAWNTGLYECELPYRTIYCDRFSFRNARDTGAADVFYQLPSDLPYYSTSANFDETNLRFQTVDVNFKQGKTYYKKTGTTYTALTATNNTSERSTTKYINGETISGWLTQSGLSGYTIWESASSVHAFGLVNSNNNNAATYYNSTTTGAMVHAMNAVFGWGPYGTGLTPGLGSPRSNGYAEYFTAVLPTSRGHREYDSKLKYYAPTEFTVAKTRSHVANANITYYNWRQAYPRNISEDLYSMFKWVEAKAGASDAEAIARSKYAYGEYTTSGGSWSLKLEAVCEDKLCMPTLDERYQAGKNYYTIGFSIASGTSVWGTLYFTKVDASGNRPTVFKRRYVPNNTTIPDGTYAGVFTKMVEGVDYNVGDIIPAQRTVTVADTNYTLGEKMPYFALKRNAIKNATAMADSDTFTDDPMTLYFKSANDKLTYTVLSLSSNHTATTFKTGDGGTVSAWMTTNSNPAGMKIYKCEKAFIWTLGNQQAGEYVKCTSDYRGNNPYSDAANEVLNATYAPSNQTLTTNNNSGVNYTYRNAGIYESIIGSIMQAVPETTKFSNTKTYRVKGGKTYQAITCTTGAHSITFTAASGNYLADTLYFTKSDDTYTLKTDMVVDDEISGDIYTVAINVKHDQTVTQWKEACAATLANVEGLGLREMECDGYSHSIFYLGPDTLNRLLWKTPNTERVAYGNHVWAQSNLRSYLNGPFDQTGVYRRPAEGRYHSTQRYYHLIGGNYVPMTAVAATASPSVVNNTYAVNAQMDEDVYVKIDGGIPVGVRLDLYNPDRYWDYGVSAMMQYKYEEGTTAGTGNWVKAYAEGSNWWEPQPSVNNGLVYDRLAYMFCEGYIKEGVQNNEQCRVVNLNANNVNMSVSGTAAQPIYNCRKGGGWTAVPLPTFRIGGEDKKVRNDAGTEVWYTTANRGPRQSFLHGFIDCKYVRTADTSRQEGKTYYFRDPYGRYQPIAASETGALVNNPYQTGLYEENPTYRADIQTASEFLDAIVPVVNRNGLYGTTDAYDMYPRSGNSGTNLGGTTTIDKVWLMSTCQIAGGTSQNNYVREEWTGETGAWDKAYPGGWPEDMRAMYGLNNGTRNGNAQFALKKWALCVNHYYAFGGADLNATRVKYAYTLGTHLVGGYTNGSVSAAYWWLRSAGGGNVDWPPYAPSTNVQRLFWENGNRSSGSPHRGGGQRYSINLNRLSPLITIG